MLEQCAYVCMFSNPVRLINCYPCRRVSPSFVCLFLRMIPVSQKLVQLGSPTLANKCSTTSPGNPFILESKGEKVKVMSQKKQCQRGSLHSCECWLLVFVLYSISAPQTRTAVFLYFFSLFMRSTAPGLGYGRC